MSKNRHTEAKLLLIGCGRLGSAVLRLWAGHRMPREITVVQPSLSAQAKFADMDFIRFVGGVNDIPQDFRPDIIVLAVKPQHVATALPSYRRYLKQATMVSLLAGVTTDRLQAYCGENRSIIRIMPNLAMQIGKSVNLAYAPATVSQDARQQVERIFHLTGEMVWLDKEALIDTLTPISGCGPAYFFLLAELLTQTTMRLGIKQTQAETLVRQTLLGGAVLASDTPTSDFEHLIAQVASKGGVTEAALHVLRPKLTDALDQALQAASDKINAMQRH